MGKYRVCVSKDWTEYGEVVIEADDEDSAREEVMGMLVDGDDSISWDSSMDLGDHRVEKVEDLEGAS